jgi:outer membrane translocation and assembly module TamA
VAFIDAGNIFGKDESGADEPFSLKELKVGYGVGVRFDTPVGLLRADVGFPNSIVETTAGTFTTKKPRFYFGFGHIF